LAGGTPQMLSQTKAQASYMHFDKQLVRDKGVATEIHYPQSSFAMLTAHIKSGLYEGRDYILLGHNLQKNNDINYKKERRIFDEICKAKNIIVFEEMPYGHGNHKDFERKNIPLHVKGILFKDNQGKANFTFIPEKDNF
jgi:hypothetical protein